MKNMLNTNSPNNNMKTRGEMSSPITNPIVCWSRKPSYLLTSWYLQVSATSEREACISSIRKPLIYLIKLNWIQQSLMLPEKRILSPQPCCSQQVAMYFVSRALMFQDITLHLVNLTRYPVTTALYYFHRRFLNSVVLCVYPLGLDVMFSTTSRWW